MGETFPRKTWKEEGNSKEKEREREKLEDEAKCFYRQ